MTVTTSSAFTAEPGATTLTLPYPSGAAGDTLLVWFSVDGSSSPTLSDDLDPSELLSTHVSTGRLRVYKRTRQSGDTQATFTLPSAGRMLAIAANLTPDLDTADPTSTTLVSNTASVTPGTDPDGPALLAVWFSFGELLITGDLLEWPDPDSNVTVGFELRLYRMTVSPTGISEDSPSGTPLVIRAVSYTTMPPVATGRWRVGSVGWAA